MRRKTFGLMMTGAALALLVGGMRVDKAWAYFTDQSYATGGLKIGVVPEPDIEEEYDDREKHVVITNSPEADVSIYARARVFANPQYLEAGGIYGNNWTTEPDADGWYYYLLPIEPGGQSEELLVRIKFPVSDVDPSGATNASGGVAVDETTDPAAAEAIAEARAEAEANRAGENFNVIVVYEATPVQYAADGTPLAPQDCDWTLRAE